MPNYAFYIMGPSGAGKDSVIDGVSSYFKDITSRPARYITRVIKIDDAEQHNTISHDVFNEFLNKDCFSLHWEANGFHYAYDKQWLNDLRANKLVLLNGSREYWPFAKEKYSNYLVPISLYLDIEVQRERLKSRGREPQNEIEKRIFRNEELSDILHQDPMYKLDANQPLIDVVNEFIELIEKIREKNIC